MTRNDGGAVWEREKALGELRAWSAIQETQAANLPDIVNNILTAAFSGASAQAAQSTLFLLSKVEELIAKVEAVHNEINGVKTVNNHILERLAEQDQTFQVVRQEIAELRTERRAAGDKLQEQINELRGASNG